MSKSCFQSESSFNETPIIHFAGWQLPEIQLSRVIFDDGRLYFLVIDTH